MENNILQSFEIPVSPPAAPVEQPAAPTGEAEIQEVMYEQPQQQALVMSEQDQAMALDYLQEAQSEYSSSANDLPAPTGESAPTETSTDLPAPTGVSTPSATISTKPDISELNVIQNSIQKDINSSTVQITIQDMMLSQIDSELDRLISETKTQEESLSGLGALWNGAIGLAGFGTAGDINHYNELATMRDELAKNPDSDKINELYSQVFQQEADVKALQNSIDAVSELQQGTITLDSGVEINHEDIAQALLQQAFSLEVNFNQDVNSQGMITSFIGDVNNVVGIGTTENMTKAQLETFQDNVEKLSKTQDPHEFASLYVSITGENLSKESLEELFEGNSKVENSKASESMMDYEETNETIQNTAIAVGTGIAVATTGPIGAIAIGAGMSVGVNAVDAATQNNGKNLVENLVDYAQTDMVKDAACGAVNGLTGKLGNIAGEGLTTVLASKGSAATIEGTTNAALKAGLNTGERIVAEFADGAVDGGLSAMGEYIIDAAAGENGNFTNNQGQIIDENGQLAFVNNLIENFDAGKMTQQALMGALMGGAMSVGMQEGTRAIGNVVEKVTDSAKTAETPKIGSNADNFIISDHYTSPNVILSDTNYQTLHNGAQLVANVNYEVPQGTRIRIGQGDLNLDELKLKPGESSTIGRSSGNMAGIQINDDQISAMHLQIGATNTGYVIRDLGSTNGTSVSFYPLLLQHGDMSTTIHKNISGDTFSRLFARPDGYVYSNSYQGLNGDCYLLSAINALYEHPSARNKILDCFEEMSNGQVLVKLPNGKMTFNGNDLMKEIGSNSIQYSQTSPGVQMLECAYGLERYAKATELEAQQCNPFSDDFASGVFQHLAYLKNEKGKQLTDLTPTQFREGGWSNEVMAMLGYKTSMITDSRQMIQSLENLDDFSNYVFTAGTEAAPKGSRADFMWDATRDIFPSHAYMVKPRKLDNGQIVVDVFNPHHSNNSSCTLSLQEFAKNSHFVHLDITKVK